MWKYALILAIGFSGFCQAKPRRHSPPPPLMPEFETSKLLTAQNSLGTDDLVRGPTQVERFTGSETAIRTKEYESSFRTNNKASRLSVMGGLTRTTQEVNYQKLNHNLYLGASFESHFHYLGIEMEGYYGTASVGFSGAGAILNRSGELRQYGVLANLNAELPLTLSKVRFLPKVGAGYGLMDQTTSLNVSVANLSPGINPGSGQSAHGPFVIAGIEIEPYRLFEISVDYARSLATAGRISAGVNPINLALSSQNGYFERIRAAIHVRLGNHLLLGAQFIQRVVELTSPLNGIGSNLTNRISPAQQHYLGVLSLEW